MKSLSEEKRQAALDALGLESFETTAFDDLVKLDADTFEVPIATISIVDHDRQWFMSPVGLDVAETPREVAFCDHTIRSPDELWVVGDATKDERFANNPLVTGEPRDSLLRGVTPEDLERVRYRHPMRPGHPASQGRSAKTRAAALHGQSDRQGA